MGKPGKLSVLGREYEKELEKENGRVILADELAKKFIAAHHLDPSLNSSRDLPRALLEAMAHEYYYSRTDSNDREKLAAEMKRQVQKLQSSRMRSIIHECCLVQLVLLVLKSLLRG